MLIHLIRHTTPAIEKGICYGQSDLNLADSFSEEREIVLAKLNANYDALYSSPLRRCARLAEFIQAEQRFSDRRLMEYNFGDWELKPWNSFKSENQQRWMNDFVEHSAPNGDSLESMRKRVMEFWFELEQSNFDKVAIVTHSGVQRLIHAYILDTPINKIFRLQLEFGAILEVESKIEPKLLTVRHL